MKYVANDGTAFDNEAEALEHEKVVSETAELESVVHAWVAGQGIEHRASATRAYRTVMAFLRDQIAGKLPEPVAEEAEAA